jgi:adenosylmethionine-8-amino-7-oxononanoate aminotransferase
MLLKDRLEKRDHDGFFHDSTHLADFTSGALAQRVIRTSSGARIKDRDSQRAFDLASKVGPKIVADMTASGVIARAMPQGDIIGFAPPFCLTTGEANRIITSEAITSVLG